MKAFLERLRPDIPLNTTFSVEFIDGGTNPQGPQYAGYEAVELKYTNALFLNSDALYRT